MSSEFGKKSEKVIGTGWKYQPVPKGLPPYVSVAAWPFSAGAQGPFSSSGGVSMKDEILSSCTTPDRGVSVNPDINNFHYLTTTHWNKIEI